MNITTLIIVGAGGIVVGYAINHLMMGRHEPKEPWLKEQWDEFQETIMIFGALFLWGAFEFLCFMDSQYASANHTNTTRLVITNIVNALFTFKFTKSQVRRNGA